MHYEGNIIRPPSEAYSILLQATVGCSHNKCTFCGAYKDVRFKIKPDQQIYKDIDFASVYCKRQRHVFLCDGDGLIIPQKRLISVLAAVKEKLPWVTRVGTYANAKSIGLKTPDELKALKDLGLGIVYMGVESGDDATLKARRKGADSRKMVEMGKKIKKAGIRLSITVLLGIAGRERSAFHGEKTGRVLTAINPEFVGALSLMLLPGTPLYDEYTAGAFELLTPEEMLKELKVMISHTHLSRGLFHANHASNYLPIKARLPSEKEKTVKLIDMALAGKITLKPEALRGL